MENKKRVQEISLKSVKILKVFKTLLQVLIAIISIIILVLLVGSFTDLIHNTVSQNLNYYGNIKITLSETTGFVTESRVITLSEIIQNEDFFNLMGELLGKSFVLLINLVLFLVLVKIFIKFFTKLNELESPFDLSFTKTLKSMFIVISILVFINAPVIGVIVALALACFYFLYKYGCELQTQYDETV